MAHARDTWKVGAETGEARVPIYVWDKVIRWCHWIIVGSIAALTLSGLFMMYRSWGSGSLRNTMKALHFLTAFVFTAAVLARIYWAFTPFGSRWARWRSFNPFRGEGRRSFRAALRFYTSPREVPPPEVIGHSGLAGAAYASLFLLFVVQIYTGFALYAFEPLSELFGEQGTKAIHALVMWLVLAFTLGHLYSVALVGSRERSGVARSMFGGWKLLRKDVAERPTGR